MLYIVLLVYAAFLGKRYTLRRKNMWQGKVSFFESVDKPLQLSAFVLKKKITFTYTTYLAKFTTGINACIVHFSKYNLCMSMSKMNLIWKVCSGECKSDPRDFLECCDSIWSASIKHVESNCYEVTAIILIIQWYLLNKRSLNTSQEPLLLKRMD